jgi:hypothetical protein
MQNNFLFKKAYLATEPFHHIAYLVQLKDERFFKVTDNEKGNIEVYKYKDGTLDIEYAVFGQKFKSVDDAFKYLNNKNGRK